MVKKDIKPAPAEALNLDVTESLWLELRQGRGERDGEMREVWEAVYGFVARTPGAVRVLERLRELTAFHEKDILRTSYWRGYHVGYAEAGPEVSPIPQHEWTPTVERAR